MVRRANTTEPITDPYTIIFNTINLIPYQPTTDHSTGLLAPLIRTIGHLLFLTAASVSTTPILTPEETQNELSQAIAHANHITIQADTISTHAQAHLRNFLLAVGQINQHWNTLNPTQRTEILVATAHRAAAIASLCDIEFAGIIPANTDPGFSL